MDAPRHWHRMFGTLLTDFFAGLPVVVEMEKDLSLKQQLLDVVVVRKTSDALPVELPDGFEPLADHNLISFKSFRETLDGWAVNEFIGHYVNYRKQVSPTMQDLLPEDDFRLFAVSARFPQGLSGAGHLEAVQAGVYRLRHFTGEMRVIAVNQLPLEGRNAWLHLFSSQPDQVRYGGRTYRPRSQETSTLLFELYERCREEGMPMPYTADEYYREAKDRMRKNTEFMGMLLEGMSAEEVLSLLSPEARAALVAQAKNGNTSQPTHPTETP